MTKMPYTIAARLAQRWAGSKRPIGKIKVAKQLLKSSPTVLIQFIYLLQHYWAVAGRGGFNHELDELANYLEPDGQLYVGN